MASEVAISVLGSGSKGNALVVHDGEDAILIDAGFSAKMLLEKLQEVKIDPSMLRGILVTHEHNDHIKGLCTLSNKFSLPIFMTADTAQMVYLKNNKLQHVKVFISGNSFKIANFWIKSFSISHDAVDPVGFILQKEQIRLGVATDLGVATQLVKKDLSACDALFIESNHDIDLLYHSERPLALKQRILGNRGHLSNIASMQLLSEIIHPKTRRIILGHISQDCNQYQLVEHCLNHCLSGIGRGDIRTKVATQDTPIPSVII